MAEPERKPLAFDRFGGLRLDMPPHMIGPGFAMDLRDVDWYSYPGHIRQRDAAVAFTPQRATNYNSIFAHSLKRLLARRAATLYGVQVANTEELASSIAVAEKAHLSFARLGTPSASYTFVADQTNTLRRFDGTTFTAPTATVNGEAAKAMPIGKFLATWPDGGNRLVVMGTTTAGGPAGAASSGSHVWFSDPGAPETFHTVAPEANYVQLNPGDGEEIMGGCYWGGKIFVFKQTRMFVFYAVGVNGEGAPEFAFRSVDLGTMLVPPRSTGNEMIAAGKDGVYFLARDGVYVTNGGPPVLLSNDLRPNSDEVPHFRPYLPIRWKNGQGIFFAKNRLYVALGVNRGDLIYVYDFRNEAWTSWSSALYCMAPWRYNEEAGEQGVADVIFMSGAPSNRKALYYYSPWITTDELSTPNAYWQSGFYDLGNPDEKTLVEAALWGMGEITLASYKNFSATAGFSQTVKPAAAYPTNEGVEDSSIKIDKARVGKSHTGTFFSHKLTFATGANLYRLVRYLRETRVATTKTGTQ